MLQLPYSEAGITCSCKGHNYFVCASCSRVGVRGLQSVGKDEKERGKGWGSCGVQHTSTVTPAQDGLEEHLIRSASCWWLAYAPSAMTTTPVSASTDGLSVFILWFDSHAFRRQKFYFHNRCILLMMLEKPITPT